MKMTDKHSRTIHRRLETAQNKALHWHLRLMTFKDTMAQKATLFHPLFVKEIARANKEYEYWKQRVWTLKNVLHSEKN